MQEEQLYAECGQDERTSIYQSYYVFALLASIYKNRLPVFSTGGSRLEEK